MREERLCASGPHPPVQRRPQHRTAAANPTTHDLQPQDAWTRDLKVTGNEDDGRYLTGRYLYGISYHAQQLLESARTLTFLMGAT